MCGQARRIVELGAMPGLGHDDQRAAGDGFVQPHAGMHRNYSVLAPVDDEQWAGETRQVVSGGGLESN